MVKLIQFLTLSSFPFPAIRLPQPHPGDPAHVQQSPVHMWHQRSQPKGLGHLCESCVSLIMSFGGSVLVPLYSAYF